MLWRERQPVEELLTAQTAPPRQASLGRARPSSCLRAVPAVRRGDGNAGAGDLGHARPDTIWRRSARCWRAASARMWAVSGVPAGGAGAANQSRATKA